jgi:predicted alpha/beta hydrolase
MSNKFNQPKTYIVGHSWGEFAWCLGRDQHPESYNTYMGIGQVANSIYTQNLQLHKRSMKHD